MASFATTTETGNGSRVAFDVKFEFISRSDVDVYRLEQGDKDTDPGTKLSLIDNGVPTGNQFLWIDNTKIQVGTAPSSTQRLKIQRTTDYTQQTVQWQDGSYIVATDLNTSEEQNLFVDQELSDWLANITGGGTGPDSLVELDDIDGIDTRDSADGEVLQYDASKDQWVNGLVTLENFEPDVVITEDEQNAGEPTSDSNIFTSQAAATRFDTFVQTETPLRTDYEVGKSWLQNDRDFTYSVWDGDSWVTVASGGSFISQPTIIYVDSVNGDDDFDGHRIINPMRTIKAAVQQANIAVTQITSRIIAAQYNNLDGIARFTTDIDHGVYIGTELTFTDQVWVCDNGSAIFPEANDPKRFVSQKISDRVFEVQMETSSKVHTFDLPATLERGGGTVKGQPGFLGDGWIIYCAPGVFMEQAPIEVRARNLSIVGASIRSTFIHPSQATETNSMFLVDSGFYLSNFTIAGLKCSGTRGGAGSVDPDPVYGLPQVQSWVAEFRQGAIIRKSPYIQNCTNFSDSGIDNVNFDPNNLQGEGGDTSSSPCGGGMLIDGAAVDPSSPLRSFVVDSFTQIALDGPGVLAKNNGYAQLVSFFGTFNSYHAKSLSGGQLNLSNCTTDFGNFGLIADGKSDLPIFSAAVTSAYSAGDQIISVGSFTRGTLWEAPRSMTPADHMVAEIDGELYPLLGSSAPDSSGAAEIIIFAPKVDESSAPGDKRTNVATATYDNTTGIVNITTDENHSLVSGTTVFIGPMVWSCTDPAGTDTFPKPPTDKTSTEFKIIAVTGSKTFRIDTTDDSNYFSPKAHTYVSGGFVLPGVVDAGAFDNGGLKGDVANGTTVKFYLQSYISTGGHTFEYTGSGTDYRAHPDFGGVGKKENQAIEIGGEGPSNSRLRYLNGGRVWLSSTDETGNFRVGETFNVNQKTGEIYILPEAIKENFVLRDDLDLRGYKIYQNPSTSGSNTDVQLQPSGTGGIVLGTADFNADGERDRPAPIVAPIMEVIPDEFKGINQADLNRASPVLTQNDVGYDADEIPLSGLLGQLAFTDTPSSVGTTTLPPEPNEIKFELSGNNLVIKVGQPNGTIKTHTLALA